VSTHGHIWHDDGQSHKEKAKRAEHLTTLNVKVPRGVSDWIAAVSHHYFQKKTQKKRVFFSIKKRIFSHTRRVAVANGEHGINGQRRARGYRGRGDSVAIVFAASLLRIVALKASDVSCATAFRASPLVLIF
jgi:hypothetical protein